MSDWKVVSTAVAIGSMAGALGASASTPGTSGQPLRPACAGAAVAATAGVGAAGPGSGGRSGAPVCAAGCSCVEVGDAAVTLTIASPAVCAGSAASPAGAPAGAEAALPGVASSTEPVSALTPASVAPASPRSFGDKGGATAMTGWLGVTAAGAVATADPVAGRGAAGAGAAITVRVAVEADAAVVGLRGVSATSVPVPGWALLTAGAAASAGAAAVAAGPAGSVAAGAKSAGADCGASPDAACVPAAGAGSAAAADWSAAGAGSAAAAGWSVAGAGSAAAAGWSAAGAGSAAAAGCSAAPAGWLSEAVWGAGVDSVPAAGALSPLDGASLASAGALGGPSALWLVSPDAGVVVDVAGAAGESPASACWSTSALSWSRPLVASEPASAAFAAGGESAEVESALEPVPASELPCGVNAFASSWLMQATIWSSVIFEKSGFESSQLAGAPELPAVLSPPSDVPDASSAEA